MTRTIFLTFLKKHNVVGTHLNQNSNESQQNIFIYLYFCKKKVDKKYTGCALKTINCLTARFEKSHCSLMTSSDLGIQDVRQ